MSDYDRFKKDHPEMLKMAEEHLEELEQMAAKLNQAIALLRRVHERNRGDGIRPTSSKLDDEIEAFLEGGDEG